MSKAELEKPREAQPVENRMAQVSAGGLVDETIGTFTKGELN
jgi:hypothetical protein